MLLKLRLDEETVARLSRAANAEHRPLSMQAEWLIRQAVGTWIDAGLEDEGTKQPGECASHEHRGVSV